MSELNRRKNYFIDKKYQTNFILKFCAIVIIASLTIGIVVIALSTQSTTVAIENTKVLVKPTADFIYPMIVPTLVLVTLFSAVSVMVLSLLGSHKLVGPLFSITREVDTIKMGDLNAHFRIRQGDQLGLLADSLNDFTHTLKGKCHIIKEKVNTLKTMVNGPEQDMDRLRVLLQELEQECNYFKV